MVSEYQLLDSGLGRKLEQVGPYRLIRPAANAIWEPDQDCSEWQKVDGVYTRKSSGSGSWTWSSKKPPESWSIRWQDLKFLIKPTAFGHLGFFAEQYENWQWLRQTLAGLPPLAEALNLFAYSGGSSLAMAAAGAKVTHLDAAKGMITWAKENLALNPDIHSTIRWIIDDVKKFIQRELKRDHSYQGIVLDPPSFGRGTQGQVWKMDDHIVPLLEQCRSLIVPERPFFVLLSCHSPGYTPLVMRRLLEQVFPQAAGRVECGEMTVPEMGRDRQLPAGVFARFSTV